MKKKILFVIDSLHSGGAEKSLVSLLSLFDYEKYDVDLLTFKENGLYIDLIHKNVNQLPIPNEFKVMKQSMLELRSQKKYSDLMWRIKISIGIRYNNKIRGIKHGSQAIWGLLEKRIQRIEKKYDIAIAYSQGIPTYFVAEKVKAAKKICWINTDYIAAGYEKKFDIKYYEKFEKMIAVSEACKQGIENAYPEFKGKVEIIKDIISGKLIKEMATQGIEFDEKFEGLRLLTIGRLVSCKGYDLAMEAAEYLKDNNIKFRWYVIGEGHLEDELKKVINIKGLSSNFKFLGTYINPYPFIKACDIYCQPSRFEGFGLAIAEAKILSKPIVVTKFDTVANQITHNKDGLIAEMNGIEIGKKIIQIIQDEKLKKFITNQLENENIGTEQEIEKIYKIIDN